MEIRYKRIWRGICFSIRMGLPKNSNVLFAIA